MKSFLLMSVATIGLAAGISGASAQTYVTTTVATTPIIASTPILAKGPLLGKTRTFAVVGFAATTVEGVLPFASGIKVVPGSIVPAYVPLIHTANVIPATGYVSVAPGIGTLEWLPTGTGFMRLGVRGWSSYVLMPALAGYSYFVSPDRKMVFVNPVSRKVLRIIKL